MKIKVKNKGLNYWKKKLLDALSGNMIKSIVDILYPGALIKSIDDPRLQKAKSYPVGTIREWSGKKYKKLSSGKWMRTYEGSGSRGEKQAIRNVMKSIQNASSMSELANIVKLNMERFKDEKGRTLPIVKEFLSAARGTEAGKKYSVKKLTKKEEIIKNKKEAMKTWEDVQHGDMVTVTYTGSDDKSIRPDITDKVVGMNKVAYASYGQRRVDMQNKRIYTDEYKVVKNHGHGEDANESRNKIKVKKLKKREEIKKDNKPGYDALVEELGFDPISEGEKYIIKKDEKQDKIKIKNKTAPVSGKKPEKDTMLSPRAKSDLDSDNKFMKMSFIVSDYRDNYDESEKIRKQKREIIKDFDRDYKDYHDFGNLNWTGETISNLIKYHEDNLKTLNDKKEPLKEEEKPEKDDSPEVKELKIKLRTLERNQQKMKDINKIVKNKKLSHAEKIQKITEYNIPAENAESLLKPDWQRNVGFASYQLTNNNAKIKNTKKRIEELKRREEQAESFETINTSEGSIEVDNDRVIISHDEKPSREKINELKRNGFRWSPRYKTWSRKHTAQALRAAKRIMDE